MTDEATTAVNEVYMPVFTKEQLSLSARYQDKADLINALLEDGREYTLLEVDAAINEFMKKEVR